MVPKKIKRKSIKKIKRKSIKKNKKGGHLDENVLLKVKTDLVNTKEKLIDAEIKIRMLKKKLASKNKKSSTLKKVGLGALGVGALGTAVAVAKKYGLLDKLISKFKEQTTLSPQSYNSSPQLISTPQLTQAPEGINITPPPSPILLHMSNILQRPINDIQLNGITQENVITLIKRGFTKEKIVQAGIKII